MRLTLVDNLIMPAVQDLNLLDVHPHLGLLSLAAVAGVHGHKVRIYDPKRRIKEGGIPYNADLYRRAAAEILEQRPEVVGFTTLGCSFLFAVRVAELLRQSEPELPVLLGGPHATMLASDILREFSCFDVIVRHEGEETLAPVLHNLSTRTFDMIPGITWRSPRGICFTPGSPRIENLDTLPILSYDDYPVEELGLGLFRVEAGRGCPYECTFCSTAQFFQRRYRLKSPARLVDELDKLNARYGVRDFKLDHDLFTVDRRKVLAFCEAVQDRGYRWRVSARVDRVDNELLEAMAKAGCIGLYFGIETGSQRLQNVIKKHLDLALVDPILDQTTTLGIEATVSVITGYPEESPEDLDASLDLIGQAFRRPRESCIPQFHLLTPEPGTPLFAEFGDQLLFDGHPTPFNARLISETDRELVQKHPGIFASYHYYPGRLPRGRHTFAVDAVDMLRLLDPAALEDAVDRFSGRLSGFMHSLWNFAERRGRLDLEADLMIDHMLTCLDLDHSRSRVYDPALRYRLSPWAHIENSLAGEPVRTSPTGREALTSGNGEAHQPACIMITSGAATTMCRLDAGLAFILELFRVPRTMRSVIREIEQLTGAAFRDETAFRKLVERDILISAAPLHAQGT